MQSPKKKSLRAGVAGLILLAVLFAACDALAPDGSLDADSPQRTGTLAPGFSVGEPMMGDVLFGGLRHRAVGEATLEVEPTTGHLVVSSLQSAQGGMSGFRTKLGAVRGVRRAFEPIDLLEDFDAVTWGLLARLPNGRQIHLLTLFKAPDGGAVTLSGDFSALADEVEVQVFNNGLLVGSVEVPEEFPFASLSDNGLGVVLETSKGSFKGTDEELQAVFVFENVLTIDVGDVLQVTGDEIRLVVQSAVAAKAAAAGPAVFTNEAWQFSSTTEEVQDVISTDIAVGVFSFFRPEIGDEVLLFHRAVGPAEMRVDAAVADSPTVGIHNLGKRGALAGMILDQSEGDGELVRPSRFAFRLRGVIPNAPGEVFSFGARGTIGEAAGKTAMVETTSLGRASLRRQGQGSIVCVTYPDFVATYTVTVTRGDAVLFESTVDADACATLPARVQQVLGVWTDMRPLSLKGPDLLGIVKLQGNGAPVRIRIRPMETAPGEIRLTGWEMTSTSSSWVMQGSISS